MRKILKEIYNLLYNAFGEMHWWPANSKFEIIVGAILTQNTSWKNVEIAIENLKEENLLMPQKMNNISEKELAQIIKPCGFYNQKAKTLKNFLDSFFKRFNGSFKRLSKEDLLSLRAFLISIPGIGNETADSILLYAFNKPIFVVDAYTKRILTRHRIIDQSANYNAIQRLFMENLPRNVKLFNNYHALLVKLGKDICKKTKPLCERCVLNEIYFG